MSTSNKTHGNGKWQYPFYMLGFLSFWLTSVVTISDIHSDYSLYLSDLLMAGNCAISCPPRVGMEEIRL